MPEINASGRALPVQTPTPIWVWLLLAYSVAHFVYSAVVTAWLSLGGDLLSAFPGPLTVKVGAAWPALTRDWTTAALGMGPVQWNYGPALHLLFLPFSFASTQFQAMRMILVLDYVLVAATFVMWMQLLFPNGRRRLAWILILCLWLNYFPLLEGIVGREIEIVELFLMTFAVRALRRERQTSAGLALGVAAMLKFLPVVFIPYLFVKGYRRAASVAALSTLAIALIAQPLLGWESSATISIASDEVGGTDFRTSYANQAITNVLYKTFSAFNINNPQPPTLYPRILRRIAFAVSSVVVLATAWFVIKWRRSRELEIEFALLAIVVCLVVSHANTYYFIFALPALSLGLAAAIERPWILSRLTKGALAAAILFCGFLIPMKLLEIPTHIRGVLIARALQGWSLPAYGAIFAAAVMLELHRASRAQQSGQPAPQ